MDGQKKMPAFGFVRVGFLNVAGLLLSPWENILHIIQKTNKQTMIEVWDTVTTK